jgi:dipeptidase D
MSRADQQRLCRTVAGLPHGVLKMSSEVPGLVETSNNVAVISTGNREVVLATSQRSPVASEIEEAAETVSSIMLLGGANVTHSTGYPGWKPNLSSPVLELAKTTYRRLFDRDPQIKAVHAGLECGIIGEKYPGMDMISFGPTMQGVHSPEEKLFIDTVPAFWTFLLAILKNV